MAVMRLDVVVNGARDDLDSLIAAMRHIKGLYIVFHPLVSASQAEQQVAALPSVTLRLRSLSAEHRVAAAMHKWLDSRGDVVLTISANATSADVRRGVKVDALRERIHRVLRGQDGVDTVEPDSSAPEAADQSDPLTSPFAESASGRRRVFSGTARQMTLSVSIYLSDEADHEQVEAAVVELLAIAGLRIIDRGVPVLGSWFRQMRAAVGKAMRSRAARESVLIAAHVADTRVVLAQDAAVTATLLQNLGPVITSLANTKDAVIRVGALMIVKVDWAVSVTQLTAAQQTLLDHRPQLAASPREILDILNLGDATETTANEGVPPAVH